MKRVLLSLLVALAALAATVAFSPAQAQQWGAIAVDTKTGDAGWSYRWNSEQQARNVAINQCKRQSRGNVCDSVYAFRGSCAAMVHGNDDNYVGAGANEGLALVDAMDKCRVDHGQACEFFVSLCSWSSKATE